MEPKRLPEPCVVLFDIDGVLVDVRASYHRVIVETVTAYLQRILDWPVPSDLVGLEHVAALKRVGGFNNDWNTVAAMLHVLVAHLPPASFPTEPTPAAVREAARPLATLPDLVPRLRRGAEHLLALEAAARRLGGGLEAISRLLSRHNAALVLYPQPLTPDQNVIVRLYQERYLGPQLFQEVHGLMPSYFRERGLIDEEKAFVRPDVLARLSRRFPLGIVTGRPRAEAVYALRRLGLWRHCRVLVSHDEVVAEMARRNSDEPLGKPHPWPLKQAADTLDPQHERPVVFFGDTVDDVQAAVRLREWRPSIAVGCTWAYEDSQAAAEHLQEAGADVIIHKPEEIEGLWAG